MFLLVTQPDVDFTVEKAAFDYSLSGVHRRIELFFTYKFTSSQCQLIQRFNASHDINFDINSREVLSECYGATTGAIITLGTSTHPFPCQQPLSSCLADTMGLPQPDGSGHSSVSRAYGGISWTSRLIVHIPGIEKTLAGADLCLADPNSRSGVFTERTRGWIGGHISGDHTLIEAAWVSSPKVFCCSFHHSK
ncbi:hypothetical protein PybrP1_003656 [[Pythium] brassicae (nom. inval.)]|nr:hypothetical protein PybrP1_003656 [[Pythium] brassicae (nom. inval.)]